MKNQKFGRWGIYILGDEKRMILSLHCGKNDNFQAFLFSKWVDWDDVNCVCVCQKIKIRQFLYFLETEIEAFFLVNTERKKKP